MIIGIPKEIKDHETRVGLTPTGVKELLQSEHKILIQKNAGNEVGFSDEDYVKAGGTIIEKIEEIYEKADLIVKVKEPQESECKLIKKGQIIFSYLHLAAEKELTENLLNSGCIAIAFETVTANDGSLPLLCPMSEVAGKISTQVGAYFLQKNNGGRGVLLGSVPGVAPAKVAIIGGGVAGMNAAIIAMGMGAYTTILDKSLPRLRELKNLFGNNLNVTYSTKQTIEEYVVNSDLVIGSVLIPGHRAPKLVTEDMIQKMNKGAVLVDIAIDQGGCFETSRPTTHSDPVFEKHGVIHYCVTNMPAAASRTATLALENATLPYIIKLANNGYEECFKNDKNFLAGLNIMDGKLTNRAVADSFALEYTNPSSLL